MDLDILYYTLLGVGLLLPSILIFWMIRAAGAGSDQSFHTYLIDLIRDNKRRFPQKHKRLLNQNRIGYPLLFHWFFSFFSIEFVKNVGRFAQAVFTLYSTLAFLVFALLLIHYSVIPTTDNTMQLGLLAGAMLLLVTIPFSFAEGNAKNVGLSARGWGVFLGQAYNYFLLLFIFTGNYQFLIGMGAMYTIILLSSAFTNQYVMLSMPLYALVFQSWEIPVSVLGGLLLFLAIMPRFGWGYLQGQLAHKTLYYKYLAKSFILKHRPHLWRDFIFRFPGSIKHTVIGTKSLRILKGDRYMRHNNVVIVLVDITLLVFMLGYGIYNYQALSAPELIFWKVIVIHFALFIGTSFRKTRFLGEPERYLEFAFGLVALWTAITFYDTPYILWGIVGLQFLKVVTQIAGVKNTQAQIIKKLDGGIFEAKSLVMELNKKEDVRFFCNSTDYTKRMLSPELDMFFFWPTIVKTDKFHFTDLHENYAWIRPETVGPIVEYYKISHFLLYEEYLENWRALAKDWKFDLEEIWRDDKLYLFKVTHKA